jgi:RimJ/RimL family protein N-acetyltransferase
MIRGERVTLRAVEEMDLPILHRWSNDPELWQWLGGWHFPYTLASARRWYESLGSKPEHQYFAVLNENSALIGTATLDDIDWKNRHAHHGMMLGDSSLRGKGYGTDTITAVMRYSFEELGLERLHGAIIECNNLSLRAYTLQRRWFFRGGRFWDRVLIGILSEEFFQWRSLRENRLARTQSDGNAG